MKGISKEHVNFTFRESLFSLCVKHKIPPCHMTMDIRFYGEDKYDEIEILICQNNHPQTEIPIKDLLTPKMVALRFSPLVLEKLFKTVHNAFVIETKVKNTKYRSRIALILYQSEKAKCPCIGVLQDDKTLKVLRLHDIIEAIELESEQLN
ncbi:hypothetical protein D3C71_563970 [compost metagenome]